MSIAIGVPIGAQIIQRVQPETFRRLCMSFDAWIVGFGLSTLVRELGFIPGLEAYGILAAVGLLDAWLLYRFFVVRQRRLGQARALDPTGNAATLRNSSSRPVPASSVVIACGASPLPSVSQALLVQLSSIVTSTAR